MTIDGSRLQISVEEQDRWRRRVRVTVPSAVVAEEQRKAAANVASRMKLKGFRKGKVPSKVVESRFGGALRQETLDRIINDAYRHAVTSQELRPISEGEVEEVTYQPESDSDLQFAISFDVEPVFDVSRLGGFSVERPVGEVNDAHIDEMIGRIQEQNGAWQQADEGKPQDKDMVSVRIRRLDGEEEDAEGREYEFALGQGDAIPDIENAIRELEVGGAGEFTVTFPDDFPAEERRGQQEKVEISLLGRKVLELPAADDELARKVGDFEDLAALKDRIRSDLQKEADEQAEAVVRGRLLDYVAEANPFEVPRSMVERYVDSVLGDQKKQIPEDRLEEVKGNIRPEAERAVRRLLIIERIAETQELNATEEEVDDRVEEIARKNDATAAQVYASLQKAGRIEALEREIMERKVFDFLKGQSEIIDAPAA